MPNDRDFTHNHYVPEWYQKRFLLPGTGKYYYLDLKPEQIIQNGHKFFRKDMMHWGPKSCFAQNDLYTINNGVSRSVDMEKFFFGQIDDTGPAAVEYFSNFTHPSVGRDELEIIMRYMSVQKLRTPKGLSWINSLSSANKNIDLYLLQRIQNIFCAIWSECVWQIADASNSDVKFIISDHPVTVYNRGCFPMSKYCSGHNDPDIRFVATHTYFPLSLNKILILTNLAWVRNPYQTEIRIRPNPKMFRGTIFNFTSIQTGRFLTSDEVLKINFITKKRAYRYVAGADKEWLYPEKHVDTQHWRKIDDGYLFMPEPRCIHMTREIVVGYDNGRSDAWNEYGQKPWQKGYKDEERFSLEFKSLERFKSEFAHLHGPDWRGEDYDFGGRRVSRDSDETYTRRLEKYNNFRANTRR